MNKKGFTLIEIIIAIALVSVIGTASFFGVKTINKNITINRLSQITDKVLEAVDVYIETNKETYNQLYKNKNGVVIPLNVLINEGLLDLRNTKLSEVDINNNYVISMLSGGFNSENCVNIKTYTSWNEASNEPIYICSGDDSASSSDVKEKLTKGDYYIAKGANPNNWVKFDVNSDSSKAAYFPNDEDKDLWRIVAIDSTGEVKLIYNKNIITNNELLYDLNMEYSSGTGFYRIKEKYYNALLDVNPNLMYKLNYYKYSDSSMWNPLEILTDYGKKSELLEQINNNFITESNYFYGYFTELYNAYYGIFKDGRSLKMGFLNYIEYENSILLGESWITNNMEDTSFIIGSYMPNNFDLVHSSNSYSYILLNDGNLNRINAATRNYVGQSSIDDSLVKYYTVTLYGGEYRPIIVLNEQVELKEDSSCSSANKPGSKECPYLAECSDCS